MTRVWQLVALWGIVAGVGTGLTAMVLAATVATRWFSHRRGLVIGMLAASSATGQLVFLPLIAELTTRLAGVSRLSLSAAVLGLAAIVALALMRDRPSDLDLPLYGETAVSPPPPAGVGHASLLMSPLIVLRGRVARADLLGAVRHLLRLRLQHQRPDPDPFHHAVPRLRLAAGGRGERACHDGRVRFRRHHRLRLAVRPLRQSLAVVLVLRAARAVAALSAVHRFHVLRPVAVRGVLRPRLDRDRAADGEADRRPLRARARRMVFGWVFAGHQIGAASAAFGAGLVRTEYLTYLPAFFIAGALCLFAALLVLTVRKSAPGIGAVSPAPARA